MKSSPLPSMIGWTVCAAVLMNLTMRISADEAGSGASEVSPAASRMLEDPGETGAAAKRAEAEMAELDRAAVVLTRAGEFEHAADTRRSLLALIQTRYGAESWQAIKHQQLVKQLDVAAGLAAPEQQQVVALIEKEIQAHAAMKAGEYKAARDLYSEVALGIQARIGGRSMFYLAAQHRIGLAYVHEGRFKEAAEILEDAVRIARPLLGDTHPDTLSLLNDLGGAYVATKSYERAETLLEEAAQGRRQVHGDASPAYAQALCQLGYLYLNTQRLPEARQQLEAACRVYEAAQQDQTNPYSICRENLAAIAYRERDFPTAREHLKIALAIMKATLPPGHPRLVNYLKMYAAVLEELRKQPPPAPGATSQDGL